MTTAEHDTDADRVQRVLEERARLLARPPRAEAPEKTVGLVVLVLGDERYAVQIDAVSSIHPAGRLASVPGTPLTWAGLTSVRGSLHAVLDLRRYLSLEPAGTDVAPKVVLVHAAGLTVGLLADDVSDVQRVRPEDIRPSQSGAAQAIFSGITPDLISVVDLDALLSDPALVVNEEAS